MRKDVLLVQLWTVLLTYALGSFDAFALTREQARANGLAWLIHAQTKGGSWIDASGDQTVTTALAEESLALTGIRYGYVAGAAASWLSNAKTPSNDSLSRQIIALARVGQNTTALVQQLLDSRAINQNGAYAWGSYPGYQVSMPDTALGLEALTVAGRVEAASTISVLSQIQKVDGGWSYSGLVAGNSSLIPTAQALHALATYVIAIPTAKTSADAIVTSGINWLIARRKNDGGFAEDADINGSNDQTKPGQVMETALIWSVIGAAQQAGFTVAADTNVSAALTSAENWLIAKQNSDGSWGGDSLQTASVLRAWATSVLADTNHTGVPDVVQPILASNFQITDTRNLPKGNGNPLAANTGQNLTPVSVPAISDWGIALMGMLLFFTGWRAQRRLS